MQEKGAQLPPPSPAPQPRLNRHQRKRPGKKPFLSRNRHFFLTHVDKSWKMKLLSVDTLQSLSISNRNDYFLRRNPQLRREGLYSSSVVHLAPRATAGRDDLAPCGIVWLSPFRAENGHQMDTKTKGRRGSHSQPGLGVRFGVHFSAKRGRIGGFQRL
jgi:hypothetical protein